MQSERTTPRLAGFENRWSKEIGKVLVRSTAKQAPREEVGRLLRGGFASVDVILAAMLTRERGNAFGHQ